jgi:hypothetical protein
MTESIDGNVTRAYYLIILFTKGDNEDALALVERELGVGQPNFITVMLMTSYKVAIFARRGRHAEVRDVPTRMRALLTGVPSSRLHLIVARAAANVLLAEGRFTDVLAEAEHHERIARESGAWAMGLDRSIWYQLQLDAALGALRQGALSAGARRRARATAEWLAERGVFDYGCLGHRALALLEDNAGRSHAARKALRRALFLSSVNTSPYHRWLCLEAARDLGAITQDQEIESAELLANGRYMLPVGWRR